MCVSSVFVSVFYPVLPSVLPDCFWPSRNSSMTLAWVLSPSWIASQHLPRGWSRQIHSWPRAQPTISPRCGASARAHRWRRAISCYDPQNHPEVEPNPSDQVREPAIVPTTREQAVDDVSTEWTCTAAEGEWIMHLGLLDLEGDLIDWKTDREIDLPPLLSPSSLLVPSSPPPSLVPLSSPEGASDSPVPAPRKCLPVPAPRKCPPSHPILLLPRLFSGIPSARPQPPICTVRAPRDCHPPASPELEYPSPPPPLAAPRRSVQPAPLGSFLPSAPHESWVTPASAWLIGSPPQAPPPPAPPPLVGPLESPSLLHVSSLCRLQRGPSSWPGSCCAPRAPGPSCLISGSSWAASQVPTCSSPCCSHGARMHLPGGGDMSGLWFLLPVTQFLPHVDC